MAFGGGSSMRAFLGSGGGALTSAGSGLLRAFASAAATSAAAFAMASLCFRASAAAFADASAAATAQASQAAAFCCNSSSALLSSATSSNCWPVERARMHGGGALKLCGSGDRSPRPLAASIAQCRQGQCPEAGEQPMPKHGNGRSDNGTMAVSNDKAACK